jgi:hypothetical protein
MLFVTILKGRPGTLAARAARRVEWEYPEGVKPVAEYWLQTDDPTVVAVLEADHVGHIMALRMDWDDLMEMETFPAITADEGIELLKQMMPA